MSDQSKFKDKVLNEKFKTLLEESNDIKKWNEGIFIKLIILLPTIIFIIGLFIVNRPESFKDMLFIFLYPMTLIFIGVIILFGMRGNLQ